MVSQILCLTSGAGLPLFTRRKGDGDPLPFSIVASLNGVHMFGKSHSVLLKSTVTEETTIVWESKEDSIILIAAACGASELLLNQLINSVFNAMVMFVGIDELRSPRNAERLKRDLRVCYPLVDHLLDCLDSSDRSCSHPDLLGMAEVILCQENHLLQSCLDAYTECLDSLYGCLLIHGRIAVATASWWTLDPEEKKLLALAVSVDTPSTARDVPVFLPCKSPNVPFRLVCCRLWGAVEVVCLCGPAPSLCEAEHVATQCWKGAVDVLRAAQQCYPRNFPLTIQLDQGVMGLLMVDRDAGKFLLSKNQEASHKDTRSVSGTHRLDVLRTFYHQVTATVFRPTGEAQQGDSYATDKPSCSQGIETYWCSEYHKCHALRSDNILMCVLYSAAVPIHTMRIITKRTLKLLTSDKQLCW